MKSLIFKRKPVTTKDHILVETFYYLHLAFYINIIYVAYDTFWQRFHKVLTGNLAAILTTNALGSYLRLRRPGLYLDEWGNNEIFTFNGHLDVKS